VIDWAKATVIDRKPDRPTRQIKESVRISKEDEQAGTTATINSAIHKTAFFTRRTALVSRSKRTEYQLSSAEGL